MGRADWYKSGSWNAICEVCGIKVKATSLRKRWDGVMVCPRDWEPRQPQDFVRGVKDNPSVPISRPEASDSFIPFFYTPYFSETVTIGINGFADKFYHEAPTPTETFSLATTKAITESTTSSEVVQFIIPTVTVLNGTAINAHCLG